MTSHPTTLDTETPTPVDTVLVLRTCTADMTSHGGYTWPTEGEAVAPDWDPTPQCGNGLHGLLWGEGDGSLLDWGEHARWLIVEVNAADIVQLNGKVKYPRGTVIYAGDRHRAVELIQAHPQAAGRAVVSGTATAGYSGTATAGYSGTATAGDSGTATAGYRGTATAGDSGTATAGYSGTATAGYSGTATAGYRGTATAGDSGTATAGYRGTATAGYSGTATAGEDGILVLHWYDAKKDRYRVSIAEIGENGIEPNVAYRLDDKGQFIRKETP